MPRTRKSHPPSLKAKVAVEAIKAQKTTAQIAQMSHLIDSPGAQRLVCGAAECSTCQALIRKPVRLPTW